jgi:uncharacterized protein YfaT (DUF1175 family)
MKPWRGSRVAAVFFIFAALFLAGLPLLVWLRHADRLVLDRVDVTLPADGRLHRTMSLRLASGSPLAVMDLRVSSNDFTNRTEMLQDGSAVLLQVTSPVQPGSGTVKVNYRNQTAVASLDFVADESDSFGDGTPDMLRLHSRSDRIAFRSWFTTLAESAASLPADRLPREIDDCAALLRWSYRGALHVHDEDWQAGQRLEALPPLGSIRQYTYPLTPLGANLFRVRPGPFVPSDLKDGAFAQFADANTLMQRNTFFVTREIASAKPGDLLFYRQLEQNSPFHSMILIGSGHNWAVYHTGPIGHGRGEMRRVALDDLLHHPDRRWRPAAENSNFLGVYRWTILREDAQ